MAKSMYLEEVSQPHTLHQGEEKRIQDLLKLIPGMQNTILEIGARDGYLSNFFTDYAQHIVALDLVKPRIVHDKITPIQGDVTHLEFKANFFDTVICTEVLEHIPPAKLSAACHELARVTTDYLIIGVPFNQDIRYGRTTCLRCGYKNPPWGHVNKFTEKRLISLFAPLTPVKIEYISKNRNRTNFLSTMLYDFAGNPWGTYSQDEPCVNCGQSLSSPRERNIAQKVASRLAHSLNNVQHMCSTFQPSWIHILFNKQI